MPEREVVDKQKAKILSALQDKGRDDFIYFDNRFVLQHWVQAIQELVDEKKVSTYLNEIEEQYSRLEIRLL